MGLFKQVSIIGVGLIGGSLAKAIRKNNIASCIVGFFRNKSKLKKAIRNKIVDKGFLELDKSVEGSELIIIALPISKILEFLPKIAKFAEPDSIITDVGSTKLKIASLADKLNCHFVGSHPLAGSEKKGVEFSQANLFENSLVIITKTKKSKKEVVAKIIKFWQALKTKVIITTPAEHDKTLAFTSHLPHLLAFSLINSIPPKYLPISSTGLKDTTRIAKSDALLWADIFLDNRDNLRKSIRLFENQLNKISQLLNSNNRNHLIKLLNHAKNKRQIIS